MPTETANALEQHVVDSINAERAEADLPALKIEVHLNAAAQGHSDWMAETGTTSHDGLGGSSSKERIEDSGFPLGDSWRTSENVASGPVFGALDESELDTLHEMLMDSAGHRDNMLDPGVAYVGVGVAVGANGRVFLTENFGNTDGEVLVQEEVDGETVYQPYQNDEPVGDPIDPATLPDDSGNETPTDPGEDPTTPPPTTPVEEEEESSSSGGGGCFVATAAYGSRSHPDVVRLRRYRDEILVRHALGRAFIGAYWRIGPRLARVVSPRGLSGRAARGLIAPLARLAGRRLERR